MYVIELIQECDLIWSYHERYKLKLKAYLLIVIIDSFVYTHSIMFTLWYKVTNGA